MKLIKLKCDGCGALLKVNETIKKVQCNYCGAEFLVDDGNTTHTHRKVDETKIKECEIKDKIHEREIKFKENEDKRAFKQILIYIGLFLVVPMILLSFSTKNNITIPQSANSYKGQNNEEVIRELEDLGFKNIETIEKKDLITGWINKDGDIAKISINGISNFKKGDTFNKKDEVIITYHTFKQKK